VPPSDSGASPTLLTGGDPNFVRVSGGSDPAASNDDVQVAQQKPAQSAPVQRPVSPSPAPLSAPAQLMAQPGRGYGELPQALVERDLSADQKRGNRAQALYELAKQSPQSGVHVLPDDWRRTKPSEVVDDIERAAQRHGVPTDLLARLLYQEGKFNEGANLKDPLLMQSTNPDKPLGWAQITTNKVKELTGLAQARGDTARVNELNSYSPADRAKAFDVAAELMAYQHRLLGSWHASVGAYNIGQNFMKDWLNGLDRSDDKQYSRDPRAVCDNWREMKSYLGIVLRGNADEPPSSKIYDYRDPEINFRVPPPIPRSAVAFDFGRISQDTRQNP
jgi:soluble lytic murein transglycosylase-like protein